MPLANPRFIHCYYHTLLQAFVMSLKESCAGKRNILFSHVVLYQQSVGPNKR
jgi:hypothetical protein